MSISPLKSALVVKPLLLASLALSAFAAPVLAAALLANRTLTFTEDRIGDGLQSFNDGVSGFQASPATYTTDADGALTLGTTDNLHFYLTGDALSIQHSGTDYSGGTYGDHHVTISGLDGLLLTLTSGTLSSFSGSAGSYEFTFDKNDSVGFSVAAAAVPEPGTWALMVVGFGASGALIRRRKLNAIAA